MRKPVTFLHGTTHADAIRIFDQRGFALGSRVFLVLASQVALARAFARRAVRRQPEPAMHSPAIVLVDLVEEHVKLLERQGLLHVGRFDPGDDPELAGRLQWIVRPEGIEWFNRLGARWSYGPIDFLQAAC